MEEKNKIHSGSKQNTQKKRLFVGNMLKPVLIDDWHTMSKLTEVFCEHFSTYTSLHIKYIFCRGQESCIQVESDSLHRKSSLHNYDHHYPMESSIVEFGPVNSS